MKTKVTKQDIQKAINHLIELSRSQRKELQDLKDKLKEIASQGQQLKKEINSLNKDTKEYTIANQSLMDLRQQYANTKKELDSKQGNNYVLSRFEIREINSFLKTNIYTSYGTCRLHNINILNNDYEEMLCIICDFRNEDGSRFEKRFRTKSEFLNYMNAYKL